MASLTPVTQAEALRATAPNVTNPGWVYSAPWQTLPVDDAPAIPRLVTEDGRPVSEQDLPTTGDNYVLARPSSTSLNINLGVYMVISPYSAVGWSWDYGSPQDETGLPLDLGTIAAPYATSYDFTGIATYNEPAPMP